MSRTLTLWGLLAGLLLALLTPLAALAAAQPGAISITAVAGFEGAYHRAAWFPVLVTLSNDGPDVSGVLEWRYPAQPDEGSFQTALDLPSGARKQVRLSVMSRNFARNGEVRLLRDGQPLAAQEVSLNGLDQDTFLIGVVSSDRALLNSLNALQNTSNGLRVSVHHFDAGLLPDQPEGLNGLNALVLHDLDTAALSPAQRSTLALWVQQGGQLVLSGGLNAERSAAGLADLLPVELTGSILQTDLDPLARSTALVSTPALTPTPVQAGDSLPPLQLSSAVAEVRVRPDAQVLAGANTPLLVFQQIGAGRVFFCAFDLAALAGWRGDLALWERTLEIRPLANLVSLGHSNSFGGLQEVLSFGTSHLPSPGGLLLALLAYIVVTGPVTYLVLRRLRRIDWAWLTLPLTMLGFAALFYFAGFGLRSGRLPISQVVLVQSVEGRPQSVQSGFVRLYSSNRSRYSLAFSPNTLVAEMFFWFRGGSDSVTVLSGPQQVELADLVVDVGSVRTFSVQSASDTALPVSSTFQPSDADPAGTLTYTGAEPLEDVVVVRGDRYQLLGRLTPGQQRELKLDQTGAAIPNYQPAQVGSINRQQFVRLLFNGSIPQLNNGDATFLLAWRNAPLLPIAINGQPADQEGVALYMVQLN